jgi:hypothetical protein
VLQVAGFQQMRENFPGRKGEDADPPADYLQDMLLSLGRVARGRGYYFLAYLIEMAALEAARLRKLSVPPVESDERDSLDPN